jgi:ferritin-like metal-binding protein YciE
MPGESLQDIYVEQLPDLYSAEQHILKTVVNIDAVKE